MLNRRAHIFNALCVSFFSFCSLCLVFWWAIPVGAAPRLAWDEDTAIISVTHLDIDASDIISDPFRHVLYASIPSAVGADGNRILPIAVPTGTLGTRLFVGSEPNKMALSNDGEYLYVGIDGANAVRRVNLISYTAEIQIPLGSSGFCGPHVARDIVVLQDNPQSIAVSKDRVGCSPAHSGVTIFDGATARPISTGDHTGADSIEPSESASLLYGSGGSGALYTLAISPTGVMISTTHEGVISAIDILFHDGLIYATDGTVVDPAGMVVQGSYASFGPLAVDSVAGVVYMIGADFDSPLSLKVFHQTEFTIIKSLPLFDISGSPERLLMVDSQHLAMLTDTGDVYLIELGEPTYVPPSFVSAPELNLVEDVYYTYYFTATDANYGDMLTISAPVLPSWLQLSSYNRTGTLSGYPSFYNIGEQPVELLVMDSQGLTATQRFTLTVVANPAYIAPTFTSTPVLTASVGITYTYNITATDANHDDFLNISAPVKPSWLELATMDSGTAKLSGIPAPSDVGTHAIEIMVTDGHGLTDTQQFSVEVTTIPTYLPPTFDSTPPLAATEAVTYTYLITASDGDPGDVLAISALGLPEWLALTQVGNGSALLSGLPDATDVGTHAVTLVVSDTHGLTAIQQFTITVATLNMPGSPSFGSTPVLGAGEGITYTYIITASGIEVGDLLTISATVLPSWLDLSPLVNGAAILHGVAGKEDIGEHAVALLVTDSNDMTDTQAFTLTVVGVGELEGVLFDDANNNGKQDEDEDGIAEATVGLTPAAESIAAMVMQQTTITTTTNITGVYRFANIPTGDYTVSFDLPGNGPNPASISVAITSDDPTVLLPVAAPPVAAILYLPNVKIEEATEARIVK
jgi:hypothetical protein